MSSPITVKEPISQPTKWEEKEYSYEYLLDLFGENTIVYELVLRCMKYEETIEELKEELDAENHDMVEWTLYGN